MRNKRRKTTRNEMRNKQENEKKNAKYANKRMIDEKARIQNEQSEILQ